jgi:hypothetical protein
MMAVEAMPTPAVVKPLAKREADFSDGAGKQGQGNVDPNLRGLEIDDQPVPGQLQNWQYGRRPKEKFGTGSV